MRQSSTSAIAEQLRGISDGERRHKDITADREDITAAAGALIIAASGASAVPAMIGCVWGRAAQMSASRWVKKGVGGSESGGHHEAGVGRG